MARIGIGADGWLRGVRRQRSPHHDRRPAGTAVDLIVVHGISLPPGCFGGPWIDRLFTNRLDPRAHPYFVAVAALKVSSHLLVRRDGVVTQYVPFDARAWHAGASRFAGRKRCNDFSIGIELEGTDDRSYTVRQYARLTRLCTQLIAAYPGIDRDRIVGHSDIAPGRKTDPGPHFDWERYRKALT